MSAGAARQEGQSALTFYYVHPDHLGSISVVTDRDGAVKQKCTYDAWGRRTLVQGSLIFDRGFTGHEHLDEFALINMNGRMYDPIIGRFLSPDPYVQSPLYAQSFNRYSYAWNNPLIYTDPDGEFIFSLFLGPLGAVIDAACWGAVIGAGTAAATYSVATLASGNKWDWGGFWKATGFGALGGALGGGFSALGSVGTFGAFGNSFGYNMLSQVSTSIVTDAIYGNDITFGSVVGSTFGAFLSASMPSFKGVQGGSLKNAFAEIGVSAAKGAYVGAFSGGIRGMIDKDPNAMMQGVVGGAISGGTGAALRVGLMGPTFIPDPEIYCDVGDYGQVYRRGAIFMPKGTGITVGRNAVVKMTGDTDYDRYLLHHETAHVQQQQQMGFANFYGRTIKEYTSHLFSPLGWYSVYTTPGTLEYGATYSAFLRLNYYVNIYGTIRYRWR